MPFHLYNYTEVRDRIENQMAAEATNFSATTDLWTSRANDPYITFTVHYIDESWELQTDCLRTTYLVEDHTGENIQEALLDILSEWNLDGKKLVAITTDSGANVKRACRLLNWKRLSCFGHNLDSAIGKALNDERVTRVLRVCGHVVAKFSISWKKKRDPFEVQTEKKLTVAQIES